MQSTLFLGFLSAGKKTRKYFDLFGEKHPYFEEKTAGWPFVSQLFFSSSRLLQPADRL
jgi:hypothetical protein